MALAGRDNGATANEKGYLVKGSGDGDELALGSAAMGVVVEVIIIDLRNCDGVR